MEDQKKVEEPAVKDEHPKSANESNVSVEELMNEVQKLKAYNEKLVMDSKSSSEKYKRLRDDIEQKKLVELEAEQNYQELNKELKKRLEERDSKLKEVANMAADRSFQLEVLRKAPDADPAYLDDLVANVKRSPLLEVNDDLTINGISEALDDLRKHKKGFFGKSGGAGFYDKRPGQPAEKKEKTLDEQIAENPNDVLKQALTGLLGG